jgi:hypothetical protein
VMAVLEELREMVEGSGAEMVVVPFPTKEEVHLPLVGEAANPLVAPFLEELDRRGIAHLDLTRDLREGAASGEKLFLEVDLHPNDAGHQRIAEILIDHLERRSAALRTTGGSG